MKKMLVALCCFCLIAMSAVPVDAAAPSMELIPSQKAVGPGETFYVEAWLNNEDLINVCTVKLTFDDNRLELTGGRCDVDTEDGIGQVVKDSKAGTFAILLPRKISGTVFTFRFRVKEDSAPGQTAITAKATVSKGEYMDVTGATVEVVASATDTIAPVVNTEEPLPSKGPDPVAPTQAVVQPTGTSDRTDPTQDSTAAEATGSTEPSDNTTEAATDTTTESQPATPARQNNWTGWIGVAAGAAAIASGAALWWKFKRKKED